MTENPFVRPPKFVQLLKVGFEGGSTGKKSYQIVALDEEGGVWIFKKAYAEAWEDQLGQGTWFRLSDKRNN